MWAKDGKIRWNQDNTASIADVTLGGRVSRIAFPDNTEINASFLPLPRVPLLCSREMMPRDHIADPPAREDVVWVLAEARASQEVGVVGHPEQGIVELSTRL